MIDWDRDVGVREYAAFGRRIVSDLFLPELPRVSAENHAPPVLRIQLGAVPMQTRASGADTNSPTERNDWTFEVPNVARYRVRSGNEIVIEPLAGASARNIRLFLLGSAFGVLFHQLGLLPLHANAILANDFAFAFAGPSGAGKSTLAAHFSARGYRVQCDDVCVVRFDDAGYPNVPPGLARVKLWQDTLEAFGHDERRLDRVADGAAKFSLPIVQDGAREPFPLSHIYILERQAEESNARIERIAGADAFNAVLAQIYRPETLSRVGSKINVFRQLALLLRNAAVYRVYRRWGFDRFYEEAAMIEQHMISRCRAGAPSASRN